MAAPRPSVSKEVFLDAALTIADQFGPDAVTTRTLGNAVGLDSTTVYRYFGSKDVLLGSLFDHVVGQAVAQCVNLEGSPQHRIRAYVAAYRSAFFAHPNVGRLNSYMADMLFAGQGEAPNTTRMTALTVGALRELGLSGPRLMVAYQMLETFVVGALLFDSGAQARGMAVRALRFRALDPSSFDSTTLDDAIVNEISDEAFWAGVDQLMAAVEKLASRS